MHILHIATTMMSTWEATGPNDKNAMMKSLRGANTFQVDGYEVKASVDSSNALPGGIDFYVAKAHSPVCRSRRRVVVFWGVNNGTWMTRPPRGRPDLAHRIETPESAFQLWASRAQKKRQGPPRGPLLARRAKDHSALFEAFTALFSAISARSFFYRLSPNSALLHGSIFSSKFLFEA